jgi:hypothetical protein
VALFATLISLVIGVAGRVGTEPELAARPDGQPELVQGALRIHPREDLVGPVADQPGEERGRQRQEDHEGDDDDAREGEAILPEASPEQLPGAASHDRPAGAGIG